MSLGGTSQKQERSDDHRVRTTRLQCRVAASDCRSSADDVVHDRNTPSGHAVLEGGRKAVVSSVELA
jgi:hypothetical protein